MTDDPDAIPIIAYYPGVPIHDQQSAHRVSTVVEPEIDRVHATSDHGELLAIASNIQWAPEARLFAGAKLLAEIDLAVDERRTRPAIDPSWLGPACPVSTLIPAAARRSFAAYMTSLHRLARLRARSR